MVAAEPDKFMLPRKSDMRYNWIHVRLDAIDLEELRELVIDGWRMCVPKSVAAIRSFKPLRSDTRAWSYRPSGAGPRPLPDDLRRMPAIAQCAAQLSAGHDAASQRHVRGPLAGLAQCAIGPVGICGRHSRCTSACTSSSVRRRHHQPREHESSPGRTTAVRRSGTGTGTGARNGRNSIIHRRVDPSRRPSVSRAAVLGRAPGSGSPASRSPSQMRRTAASVSAVEDQLDGMDHQPTQTRDPPRVERRRAHRLELGGAQRSRARGQHRTHRRQPAQRVAIARLGRTRFGGHAPITSPAHGIPWAASASNVSAVWFSVPSPGATTTSTGAARSHARSRSVTPSAPSSTSSPPAPSTRVSFASDRRAPTPTSSSRVGSASPARCAAAAGASGSG